MSGPGGGQGCPQGQGQAGGGCLGTMTHSGPAAWPGAAPMGGVPIPVPLRGVTPTPRHPLREPTRANKTKLTCISINFPASIHPGLITAAIPGAGGLGRL